MELVIIITTITAFFCHYLIEKRVLANVASVVITVLIVWLLNSWVMQQGVEVSLFDAVIMVATVVVISMLVGLVFIQHKRCSK